MQLRKIFPKIPDLQGHRGCRGLMPENTLPAFQKALEIGVSTLEMDVVITKDRKVLVSHDPFFSHEFCRKPDGADISAEEEQGFRIYQMNYEEVKIWDCGLKPHPRFPSQQKMPAAKPLLEEVIQMAKDHQQQASRSTIFYNIEIKSTLEGDGIFHPSPPEFSELLLEILYKARIASHTTIQSFDLRPLQYIHEKYENIILSLLVENKLSAEENIDALGFVPDVYSPDFSLVDERLLEYCREKNMRVIPWTVNDIKTMERLIRMGVHGIISDYPDLYRQL